MRDMLDKEYLARRYRVLRAAAILMIRAEEAGSTPATRKEAIVALAQSGLLEPEEAEELIREFSLENA